MLVCMRTSVHIPDDLLRRAKKKALAEGRTLTSLIEEGLRSVLAAGNNRPSSKPREPLPISSVSDGVLPGIDLTRSAEIQDVLDEQVIRDAGLIKLR